MHIGPYTFEEFKAKAAEFHGYPAPGLLLGGYMVSMAQKALPDGTLFEVVVESKKCLPDAVQLLTLCSTGNNWMKVINLGKYAVSLFDKYTGEGYRVHVNVDKLAEYPEIKAWFLKEKPKNEQDTEQLFKELRLAGESVLGIAPIRIHAKLLGHAHMGAIGLCPRCAEAFPVEDGILCRGCQGEAPYRFLSTPEEPIVRPRILPVEEAVGKKVLHDMTQIIPGESKGTAFVAGQEISAGDVCRLQQMGRFSVAVQDVDPSGYIHENDGAEAFAQRMAGANVAYELPPQEGKINFKASIKGLLSIDRPRLYAFNLVPDVMAATRQDGTVVDEGSEVGGTRIIPLYIRPAHFAQALQVLEKPLMQIMPLRQAKVGILVTGTEVFQGLIQDRFVPLVTAKVEHYGCEVVYSTIVPDSKQEILEGIDAVRAAGADLLITTGGLSVDPDDVTRAALVEAGTQHILYGAPVLPGAMSLTGLIPSEPTAVQEVFSTGHMQVLGVPACALYFKTTLFDILLPRLLAGRIITRHELASLAEGGFCMNCKVCTYPKCFFVK